MTIFAKAFHVSIDLGDPASPHNNVTVCTHGQHARCCLRLGVLCDQTADGWRFDRTPVWSPCDRSCRHSIDLREVVDADVGPMLWEKFERSFLQYSAPRGPIATHAREYCHRRFEDGDSDESLLCSGQFHIRRHCSEFGLGDMHDVIGICDSTCRTRRVRIPPEIERHLRR